MEFSTQFAFLPFFILLIVYGIEARREHYVVYMGSHSHSDAETVMRANHEILSSVTGSFDDAKEAAVHHYSKSFRGFSAMLTPEQAQLLKESESVISVFRSRMSRIHTTRSWDFLQVNLAQQYNHLSMDSKSNVIVGVIDSGIWPESESFHDRGLTAVPTKFRGECVTGDNFNLTNCNRKIVGARFYVKGFEAENGPLESFNKTFYRSARDSDGHGTHTASTIAGREVANASLSGIARGTARGGAPSARLAIYKACWFGLCSDADILSAFDDAIHDGVDILSVSLGPDPPQPLYFEDSVSVGSFHAFHKGILVSASAGNSFLPGTAANVAPWILTVAASSLDREFSSKIHLGNAKVLKGFSVNPLKMEKFTSLIAGSAAPAKGVSPQNASFCKSNTLDPSLVSGKIVLCKLEIVSESRKLKAEAVRDSGGVGMILSDPLGKDIGFQFVIPSTIIGNDETEELDRYISTEKIPVAKIYPTITVSNIKPAPDMAVFSSMGPNVVTPEIIKPDITGPGLNILAAWSPVATDGTGDRSVDYNIISGTSMSCPHVSALAAILKSCHPDWSPAAIKSAIMTTAALRGNNGELIVRDPDSTQTTPFDYGSGHMNPIAAINPGLVYEFGPSHVIDFLCATGASPAQLRNLTGELVDCKRSLPASYNFNYPSIGVSNMKGRLSVWRSVTYYGHGPTTYVSRVECPAGVRTSVTPSELKFTKNGETASFRLDFAPLKDSNGTFVFGSLTWISDWHKVRSPIALNVLSV
ncbi:hypothetical protein QQ045_004841 [Rhodiola kirilowii]